jgi:hypothetical protein
MRFSRRRRAASDRPGVTARTVAAVGAVGAGVVGMLFALAVPASAHTPHVSASCVDGDAVLNVSLTNYDASKPNSVVAKDGSTTLVDTSFGTSYSNTWKRPGDQARTFTVAVKAWDDPDGRKGWSFSKQLTTPVCTPPSSTNGMSVPPPTLPSLTTPPSSTTKTTADQASSSSRAVAAVAPTSTSTAPASTALANTGADVGPVLVLGVGLLGAGAVLLGARRVAARRQRR